MWDSKWMERMTRVWLVFWLAMRYMDDGRAFLPAVKPGWRWVDEDLKYCRRWELEDSDLTPTERTKRVLHGSMRDIEEFLNFTMETGEDFDSGWLATLDTDLQVNSGNRVEYKFYQKPMASNVGVQKQSAMKENGKMKTLSNDLTRRLLNTSESLGMDERITVIDDYGQRMLNSGFGITQSQKIVLNGIKDYERKLRESRKINGRKLHRTALESSGHRSRKKLLDKTEWFKKRRRVQDDEEQKPQKPWQPKNNTRDRKEQKKL